MTELPKGPDLLSPSALFASGLAGTDRLVILGNDLSISGRFIFEHTRHFSRTLGEIGPRRVAVWTSRPETVLAAIGAAINVGSELVLLPSACTLEHPLLQSAGIAALFDENLNLVARGEGVQTDKPGLILPASDGKRLVAHDMDAFLSRVPGLKAAGCWLLTTPVTGFAGLQVLLSAFGSQGILLAYPDLSVPQLAQRAVAHQVSHITGTPVFFRSLLRALKEQPGKATFKQITLCEEFASAGLLDQLRGMYPKARLNQLYGSVEAGTLFTVHDGLPGFPAEWLDQGVGGCQLRILEGRLEIISPGVMREYIGTPGPLPYSSDGWFKPGYAAERQGDRVLLTSV